MLETGMKRNFKKRNE